MPVLSAKDFFSYNPKNLTHCALCGLCAYAHNGKNVAGLAKLWGDGQHTPQAFRDAADSLYNRMNDYQLLLDRIKYDHEHSEEYLRLVRDYEKTEFYRRHLEQCIECFQKDLLEYYQDNPLEDAQISKTRKDYMETIENCQRKIAESEENERNEGYETDLPQRLEADPSCYTKILHVTDIFPAFEISDEDLDLLILGLDFELMRPQINEAAWGDNATVTEDLRMLIQRLETLNRLIEPDWNDDWEEWFDPNDGMLQLITLGNLEDLRKPNKKFPHAQP